MEFGRPASKKLRLSNETASRLGSDRNAAYSRNANNNDDPWDEDGFEIDENVMQQIETQGFSQYHHHVSYYLKSNNLIRITTHQRTVLIVSMAEADVIILSLNSRMQKRHTRYPIVKFKVCLQSPHFTARNECDRNFHSSHHRSSGIILFDLSFAVHDTRTAIKDESRLRAELDTKIGEVNTRFVFVVFVFRRKQS